MTTEPTGRLLDGAAIADIARRRGLRPGWVERQVPAVVVIVKGIQQRWYRESDVRTLLDTATCRGGAA